MPLFYQPVIYVFILITFPNIPSDLPYTFQKFSFLQVAYHNRSSNSHLFFPHGDLPPRAIVFLLQTRYPFSRPVILGHVFPSFWGFCSLLLCVITPPAWILRPLFVCHFLFYRGTLYNNFQSMVAWLKII